MKKNGFTLIELLTVIILLGMVALMTVPVVNGVIGKASSKNARNSGEGLLRACKIYYTTVVQGEGGDAVTINFPDVAKTLDLKGDAPTTGTVEISEDGKIKIAVVYSDKWCVTKAETEDNVSVRAMNSSDVCSF